ncbi:MAG: SDR family oxidoreductase, partial [Actinomycetota bacterium]|nr:SDR family oxidoreductase [Actinomycetota bacterium]
IGASASAEQLVEEVRAAGGRALAAEADVSGEEQVSAMFRQAHEELGGPVDLLVNNAGVQSELSLLEMTLEEWNRVLAVNLTGAFLCARECARQLIEAQSPGVVVNVSSVHERIPWPRYSHYCASKAGLKLFGQTIARELASQGIRVVTIAPGAIVTPINQDLLEDEEKRAHVQAQIPWGRMGRAEEVAAAVAWLAGREAEYVVGTTLFFDGGMTLYQR